MAWIAWDTLTKAKGEGGLGFQDIQCFNDALLGKLSWRLLNNSSCLLARILRGKYNNHESMLEAQATNSCSHGWRVILIGRDLLVEHLVWAIGDGKAMKIWEEPWLSTEVLERPMGPATEDTKDLVVEALFQDGKQVWDPVKVERILQMATSRAS